MLKIDAFRVRLDGEDVVLHDTLRLGLTVPGPGRTFTFATMDWDESAERFLGNAAAIISDASKTVDLAKGNTPDFAYYTAVPAVPFIGLTHVAPIDPTAGQPMTAFGKFREDGERLWVPVGLQVNHMYVDGVDIAELYEGAVASFAAAF